jgi:hypothetical protein
LSALQNQHLIAPQQAKPFELVSRHCRTTPALVHEHFANDKYKPFMKAMTKEQIKEEKVKSFLDDIEKVYNKHELMLIAVLESDATQIRATLRVYEKTKPAQDTDAKGATQ